MALAGGATVLTGLFLTGQISAASVPVSATFSNCGQGLREGGDVKTRGVLVGRIETISRVGGGDCRVDLALFPDNIEEIPANVAAQIRAKTVFGEKWVELLYPEDPVEARLAADAKIEETIDPLEIEGILDLALPLLDAIDPEHLAGALEALAGGFVGHEEAAIRGIESGTEAVRVATENTELFKEGLDQLAESADVLDRIDEDFLTAMEELDRLNRFTIQNAELIAANLDKAPELMRELSVLFETRFVDLTKIVDRGATVIGVLASRTDDLERLLQTLPRFNSNWIRNLNHTCRFRTIGSEPDTNVGDEIPGRCWRVHNLFSQSQGAYAPGEGPKPNRRTQADYEAMGLADPSPLGRLLFAPAAGGSR